MSLNVPKVMVSSTFYDLRQIRTDLANFITDDLCYIPLLSELSSFPVDPDANIVENCCRRVEQDADILILIIGGRYGSIDTNSSRSITNLEYLAARTKGIPIYVFVEKAVIALLPIWERNKDADFSASIDDVRLLEFIYQIRSVDRAWVHEFENAQQIVSTLRTQFAYRMREGLQLAGRLKDEGLSKIIYALGGKALRIALEKPSAWEYRLFSQVLVDEVEEAAELRREYELGIALGIGEGVPRDEISSWGKLRMAELKRMVDALEKLINDAVQQAFGPAGEPGDTEAIVFVARQVGAVYREAIEWSQRVKRAAGDERFSKVVESMAQLSRNIVEKIENYGPDLLLQIENALANPRPEGKQVITMTLIIGLYKHEEFLSILSSFMEDGNNIKQESF